MALTTTSWFPFWRPRNRFSLEELRYLTEELQKIEIVNDINEDLVIEMLRSIAELMTYGGQHDPSYFEFFMEKQIISEFVRILRISKPTNVSLQLLQTMSIMIENLADKNSIYYLFSNGHINQLITYSYDFQNEEILPYYISFLRAISRKLNKNTISLLVKTEKEEVVSFPLYFQAIQFAFHEDNMVRVAVRALTLNVYNVGDEQVNKYVKCTPQSDYFSNIIRDFYKRCIYLDKLIAQSARKLDASVSDSSIRCAINEIEDILYYLSDILSVGVPGLGRLLTDYILELIVFVLLLPSLKKQSCGTQVGITTSLHLLCSVLNIYNSKDLVNIIAAALLCSSEFFSPRSKATTYGYVNVSPQDFSLSDFSTQENIKDKKSPMSHSNPVSLQNENCGLHITLRELLLAYIIGGDELQIMGSLSLLATLLQTNDLDESVLAGLGILSQRKQHKDLFLQALAGEETSEEKLISKVRMSKDNISTELSGYLQKLEDKYGCHPKSEINSKIHTYQVFNALLHLLCRTNTSADILWLGGWVMKQLLPYHEEDCSPLDLQQLEDSHKLSAGNLLEEINGYWCDVLIPLLKDKWNICKKVIEASSPAKDSKSILFPSHAFSSGGESSFAAAGKMCETIKVFVLQRQLLLALGVNLPDLPYLYTPVNSPVASRTKTSILDATMPKPGSKISLDNAIPCRISFEVGKENNYSFLAISRGTSGWVILAEELLQEQQHGVVFAIAPLAASNPFIDEKQPTWLHLRIRPSTFPFIDPSKFDMFYEAKDFSDGRWTLAFRDEQACKAAESALIEELNMQRNEVEQRLKPLLQLELCTLHKTNA
ncbi:protein TRANSPARENT TESTA 9-like isoform X2 [Zingiber officinale]|uniref:protein TRANSPARENT TESTA 9-like isoform X2 n=1 Tax=Zingiber officinale TaxID=94328 RepID=UPI001C4BCA60|nr:protein TRANSPARENT TESTA 9-like isoform X2 [Zingiber officinale]